jgi:hypothetical protein
MKLLVIDFTHEVEGKTITDRWLPNSRQQELIHMMEKFCKIVSPECFNEEITKTFMGYAKTHNLTNPTFVKYSWQTDNKVGVRITCSIEMKGQPYLRNAVIEDSLLELAFDDPNGASAIIRQLIHYHLSSVLGIPYEIFLFTRIDQKFVYHDLAFTKIPKVDQPTMVLTPA